MAAWCPWRLTRDHGSKVSCKERPKPRLRDDSDLRDTSRVLIPRDIGAASAVRHRGCDDIHDRLKGGIPDNAGGDEGDTAALETRVGLGIRAPPGAGYTDGGDRGSGR